MPAPGEIRVNRRGRRGHQVALDQHGCDRAAYRTAIVDVPGASRVVPEVGDEVDAAGIVVGDVGTPRERADLVAVNEDAALIVG